MIGRNFSHRAYESLLDAIVQAGYRVLPVREFVCEATRPAGTVVLRHDVDRLPERALEMADLEADRGLSSTFYFRTVPRTFRPPLIREISSLGHEIGYHYEVVDQADGDLQRAHELFEANLARLRKIVPIETACKHGNPRTPYDNHDLWNLGPGWGAYSLVGEAYRSMDFDEVAYFSDTGRSWGDGPLRSKHRPDDRNGSTIVVESTPELATVFAEQRVDRACVLVHPDRWASDLRGIVSGRARDTTANVGKRMIRWLS